MSHEANVTAADGISHPSVLPELATDAASRRCPVERPFTAQERDHVIILFGGFTWKHERFIQAAFQACGYRFQALPNPALTSYHLTLCGRLSTEGAERYLEAVTAGDFGVLK